MSNAQLPVIVSSDQDVDADRSLLGGKGASLFSMANLGLPVPSFFVLTTHAWHDWDRDGCLSETHISEVMEMMGWLERQTGRTFGRGPRPLLVSVRSACAVSMPGMMDTILNLGLTADTIGALFQDFRSLQIIADVITNFVGTATPVFAGQRGRDAPTHPLIPETARDQLIGAIEGVFASWNNDRARLYRQIHHIPDDYGTAAVVQAMVFGNADASSGTGVLFTRDPVTGADEPRGEWVPAAQGEAIVSGRSTPVPVAELASSQPGVYAELLRAAQQLEIAAGEPQDIEFTVEGGKLYLLQTRALKVTPLAACTITLALLDAGSISRQEAVRRLSSLDVTDLVTEMPRHPPHESLTLAAGLAASPGIARGTAAREVSLAGAPDGDLGMPWILIRPETSPHDLPAMRKAAALVTERGGLTSHAAIVARELRIPCVVGCGDLTMIRNGQEITVDGTVGRVYEGTLETESSVPDVVRRAQALLTRQRE